MSTLSSSSTDQEVWDSYDDNSSYEEDSSRTKALAFITACRILLRRRPQQASRGGQTFNFEAVSEELASARRWVQLHPDSSTAGTRYGDLQEFRD